MSARQQHHLKLASLLFSNLFPLLLHLTLPQMTFTKQQFLPANFSIPSQPLLFSSKLNPGHPSWPDPDRNNKVNRPKTPLPLPLPISPPASKTFLPSPMARSTSTVLTCDHRLYQVSFTCHDTASLFHPSIKIVSVMPTQLPVFNTFLCSKSAQAGHHSDHLCSGRRISDHYHNSFAHIYLSLNIIIRGWSEYFFKTKHQRKYALAYRGNTVTFFPIKSFHAILATK